LRNDAQQLNYMKRSSRGILPLWQDLNAIKCISLWDHILLD
jgi:hypothetical protein